MTSEVDICNLSLSYLGDTATVASINPPSGSAQSSHCARFYSVARDQVQEEHPWNFCTFRQALALVTNPTVDATLNVNGVWTYAYAAPSGMLNALAVMDPAAASDYWTTVDTYQTNSYQAPQANIAIAVPQPFVLETASDGSEIILTNQQYAILRFTKVITDTTKFSPLFVEAHARLLASKLAGPILKGDEGRKEAKAQLEMYQVALAKAKATDSNDRSVKPPITVAPWMARR